MALKTRHESFVYELEMQTGIEQSLHCGDQWLRACMGDVFQRKLCASDVVGLHVVNGDSYVVTQKDTTEVVNLISGLITLL